MKHFLKAVLLTAALIAPLTITSVSLQAQPPVRYHDNGHNDDHEWNAHEDQAYRIYEKENHRKYRDFSKLKEEDRQSYWGWRHEHSDALLKIEVR
jgi:hypothetical protein